MSNISQIFLYSPLVETLRYPEECPFKTERASIARRRLLEFGWLVGPEAREIHVEPATIDQLLQFHTPEYVEELQRADGGELTVRGIEMGLGTPDTPVFRGMFAYSALACGASVIGARLIGKGGAKVVFNLMGGLHHARPARAAGFCYLNDVVLACLELVKLGHRVLYLDLDAHHGDGVQEAFYSRNEVLTISLHETGKTLYPGTGFEDEIGEGSGVGYCVNIPLPPGTYDEAYLLAFKEVVEPLAHKFDPDTVIAEFGMDALAGDPLTHLKLTNRVFLQVVEFLKALNKPVLVLGGGGYNVENTVRGWLLCWKAFGEFGHEMDWSVGMGGVFLGNSEWVGGLEDGEVPVSPDQRQRVESELIPVLQRLKLRLFPQWGLPVE